MSWVITPSNLLVDDQDALTYLTAVEAADGQALESATRLAVNAFVKGCKSDGIWPAIKASCILAGARTLTGALAPLAGTVPTNVGPFVSGDYNRKTGLVGNGSTKYLNSNRLASADPTNSFHMSTFVSTAAPAGSTQMYMGGQTNIPNDIFRSNNDLILRSRTASNNPVVGGGGNTGFMGHSRNVATSYTSRTAQTSATLTVAPVNADSANIFVFARNNNGSLSLPTNARLAFYSIGESLDLALLDTRVTDLINAFAAAIP
jgi:hypothetical protein